MGDSSEPARTASELVDLICCAHSKCVEQLQPMARKNLASKASATLPVLWLTPSWYCGVELPRQALASLLYNQLHKVQSFVNVISWT